MVVYLGVASPLIVAANNSGGESAVDLAAGVLAAAVLLVVVAAIALLLSRWRDRRNSDSRDASNPAFGHMLTSLPVVLIALVVAGVAAAGGHRQAHRTRAALATSDATSTNPTDQDRGALAAWMTSVPAGQQDKALALHQLGLIDQGLGVKSVDLPRLVTYARTADRHAAAFVRDVRTEPAATADVRTIRSHHQQEANLFRAAIRDYLLGLRRRDEKLLTAGDALIRRSEKLAQETARDGEALYHRLGGYKAFGTRINFAAYERAVQRAQQAAKP